MGGKGAKGDSSSKGKKAGGVVNPGKTVSRGALKREAHQGLSLQVSAVRSSKKSPKLGASDDVHTGLTPVLAGASLATDLPPAFSLDVGGAGGGGAARKTRSQTQNATAKASAKRGGGRGKQAAGSESVFGFVHVGGGGTGKRYTGASAEKAAKKAWRDNKALQVIELKGSDGATIRFNAIDWVGQGGNKPGGSGPKFKDSGKSHRSKTAAFAGRGL